MYVIIIPEDALCNSITEVKVIFFKNETDPYIYCEDCEECIPAEEAIDGLCVDCCRERLISSCNDYIVKCFLAENRGLLTDFIMGGKRER